MIDLNTAYQAGLADTLRLVQSPELQPLFCFDDGDGPVELSAGQSMFALLAINVFAGIRIESILVVD